MWEVSQAFLDTVKNSVRRWYTRVDISAERQVVKTLDYIVDGSVTVDDTAIRRTAKVQCLDPTGDLTPQDWRDLLSPKGTEFIPHKGLLLPNGTVEWVRLGTFQLTNVDVGHVDGRGVVLSLDGSDRAIAVRARSFNAPYVVHEGTSTKVAIGNIVNSRFPVPWNLIDTGSVTPELLFDVLSDPWNAVQKIAEADSLYAFFDPLGRLSTLQNRKPIETGVAYRTMHNDALVLDLERSLPSDEVYSGVIVHVEHPDRDPIHVEVWDDDPDSPTYYLGPFGKRPFGITTTTIHNVGQATRLANNLVRGVVAGFGTKVIRQRQSATLVTAGIPGHEIGDAIRVYDEITHTKGRWIVKGVTIPLRAGPVTLRLLEAIGEAPDGVVDSEIVVTKDVNDVVLVTGSGSHG